MVAINASAIDFPHHTRWKIAEKVLAKKRKDSLKKDMTDFKNRVKAWADKNLNIDDVLEFFNFI